MSASEKQIAANRQNSLRSTGPVSPEGKARASQNALAHGLLAKNLILPNEDRAQFEDFSHSLLLQLNPAGLLESYLAARVVSSAWRLYRMLRVEKETFLLLGFDASKDAPSKFQGQAIALLKDGRQKSNALEKLTRYESHLHKLFRRDLAEYRKLQSSRPASIGVSIVVETSPDPSSPSGQESCKSCESSLPDPQIGFVSQNFISGNSESDREDTAPPSPVVCSPASPQIPTPAPSL